MKSLIDLAIDDRGTWVAATPNRRNAYPMAVVQQMADGKWIAKANDGGGMAIASAIEYCPHAAARNAIHFGFHEMSRHEDMAALADYLLATPHPSRCTHVA